MLNLERMPLSAENVIFGEECTVTFYPLENPDWRESMEKMITELDTRFVSTVGTDYREVFWRYICEVEFLGQILTFKFIHNRIDGNELEVSGVTLNRIGEETLANDDFVSFLDALLNIKEERALAVAMGTHFHLGESSPLAGLDPDIIHNMILRYNPKTKLERMPPSAKNVIFGEECTVEFDLSGEMETLHKMVAELDTRFVPSEAKDFRGHGKEVYVRHVEFLGENLTFSLECRYGIGSIYVNGVTLKILPRTGERMLNNDEFVSFLDALQNIKEERALAVAMGTHLHLGERSPLADLRSDIIRMILCYNPE